MTLTPTTLRLDLKCGKGSISPGEKCHVATAKAPENATSQKKRAPIASGTEKFLKRAGVLGVIGSLGYTAYGAGTGRLGRVYAGLSAVNASSASLNYGISMQHARKGQKTKARESRNAAALNLIGAGGYGLTAHMKGRSQVREEKAAAAEAAAARRRAKQRKKQWEDFQNSYRPGGSNYRGGSYGAGAGGYGAGTSGSSRRGTRRNTSVTDPFKDLGVAENASDSEVKKAWMKAMRQHHPDVGGDPEVAKQTNAAYQEIRRRRGLDSNLDASLDSVWAYGFQP